MRYRLRYSSFLLTSALLLCFGASSAAQQIQFFPDFSGPTNPNQFLHANGGVAGLATWNNMTVLRLTTGGTTPNGEASTVYFKRNWPNAQGVGEQRVDMGFTTWFQFQAHNLTCCTPGDGFAFIVQYAPSTDSTYGAGGSYSFALGAGNGGTGGGMGYAGINNSLAIEFDLFQNAWDPNGNHIAIQSCGINTNTPVHNDGNYTIGNHQNVPNCLYPGSLPYTPSQSMGGSCSGDSCMDGKSHDVVIEYTPPNPILNRQGVLQIWLDPTYIGNTHSPKGSPNLEVPYNIVYDEQNNPNGLELDKLDPKNPNLAWVGFTASQPDEGLQLDILAWEFTPGAPSMIQQVIQPGGTQTLFSFGSHDTGVTYPKGFQNINGTLMTVLATPINRTLFYQTRLMGTGFANEQCVVYLGTGGTMIPISSGNCIVYSYSCQDSTGMNQVDCPTEDMCDPINNPMQCIDIDTDFYTSDPLNMNNTDYLENDAKGSNNWMSIFTGYSKPPIDDTLSGKGKGFGGSGSGQPLLSQRRFLTGDAGTADIVGTFCPTMNNGQVHGKKSLSGCSQGGTSSASQKLDASAPDVRKTVKK